MAFVKIAETNPQIKNRYKVEKNMENPLHIKEDFLIFKTLLNLELFQK